MSKHFITFGSGNSSYIDAGKRLTDQAKQTQLFDLVEFFTIENLKKDPVFWNKHQRFIINNKRGFGYWLWKSYIVKKKMEQMKDGDILLYLDCGCEIDVKQKSKLETFFKQVKKDKIVGTMCGTEKNGHLERDWTKMDLFLKLNMNKPEYTNTVQRQGGTNMFYICDETRKIVNEWYNISCDYHLIDDSKSVNKNYPTFQEHRHDQSIFSLLTKKYKLFSKLSLYNSGIVVGRNISGKSRIGQSKIQKRDDKIKMIFYL